MGGFGRQNRGRGGAILTQQTRSYLWGFLRLCQFWWKSIKKCDRESARRRTDTQIHWHTDRLIDANRFHNLSHAICYSYGTDNHRRSNNVLDFRYISRFETRITQTRLGPKFALFTPVKLREGRATCLSYFFRTRSKYQRLIYFRRSPAGKKHCRLNYRASWVA